MSESNLYHQVQLRMGIWLEQGLPLPIDDINNGKSRDLLNRLLGRVHVYGQFPIHLNEEQRRHCQAMLGLHGYSYYRMLLLKIEEQQNGT